MEVKCNQAKKINWKKQHPQVALKDHKLFYTVSVTWLLIINSSFDILQKVTSGSSDHGPKAKYVFECTS